jgi:hypothetical protein
VPVAVRFLARNTHARIQGREDLTAIAALPEIKADVLLTILQQWKVRIVFAWIDAEAVTQKIKLVLVGVGAPRHTQRRGADM